MVIDTLIQSPEVKVAPLTSELFDAAYRLYSSHLDKEWGLVDCISFIVMRQRGVTDALTFDQHLVQAGFRALLRAPRVP